MGLPKEKIYTAEEFFAITPDNNSERYELYDGEIVALAAPSIGHQRLLGNLFFKFKEFINRKKCKCEPFISPCDVMLDDENVVQPDMFILCDPSKLDSSRCNGAPDFVIEIASSNRSNDFIRKLALYERFGVHEYWIVDLLHERTVVYCLDESHSPNIYTIDSDIPVEMYKGELTVNIKEIME